MTTPGKNFNYNSPYTNPVQKYPSQSVDYISLDMGGPMRLKNVMSSNEKTPGRNLTYYEQNYRNSNSKANRRNLFNNSYGQQRNRQNFNQQQRYGPRKSNERYQQQQNIRNSNEKRPQERKNNHNDKSDNNSIASYCHPSMTEDPWFELTQRVRALEKSKISIKETSPSLDSNSNSGSDNEREVDSPTSD